MTPSDKAIEILRALELKENCSVPLQKILEHIEYKAQLFPASEKTKNIACGLNVETKVVMANSADSPQEQRYAFAHAIGHAVLHEDKGNVVDKRINLNPENETPDEWDANQFANELLMESTNFLGKWDEFSGDRYRLATLFGVSTERIIARAKQLGLLL